MSLNRKPHIFVVGNEKGGAGKTTCSMHLIIGLLDRGYHIASIDVDSRQGSLSSYINNRKLYNDKNPGKKVLMPVHFHIQDSTAKSITDKEEEEKNKTVVPVTWITEKSRFGWTGDTEINFNLPKQSFFGMEKNR